MLFCSHTDIGCKLGAKFAKSTQKQHFYSTPYFMKSLIYQVFHDLIYELMSQFNSSPMKNRPSKEGLFLFKGNEQINYFNNYLRSHVRMSFLTFVSTVYIPVIILSSSQSVPRALFEEDVNLSQPRTTYFEPKSPLTTMFEFSI